MAISDLANRKTYVASGQTSFSFPFRIFSASDLVVYVDGVLKTLNTDYTVTNYAEIGGNIVFDSAPAVDSIILVYRDVTPEREVDYVDEGPFDADPVNLEMDRFLAITQELRRDVDRRIGKSITDVGSETLTLPDANARKNRALVFDSAGNVGVSADDYVNQVAAVEGLIEQALEDQQDIVDAGNVAIGLIRDEAVAAQQGAENALADTLDAQAAAENAQEAAEDARDEALAVLPTVRVDSIAALRLLDTSALVVEAVGYYAPGDGGGGNFWYDGTDSTTTDNGGSVVVGIGGKRWKRSSKADISNVRCWGAKGDGVTVDTAPFMACIAYQEARGGRVDVPLGDYPVALVANTGGITIECEPGTILRAASSTMVFQQAATVTGPTTLIDAELRGQYKSQEGVPVGSHGNGFEYENTAALHGVGVYGPNLTLIRCKIKGCRFDSLYGRVQSHVNGGVANFRAIDCDFGDAARNVVSLVDGHYWYFTGGRVWNEGRYYHSGHGFKSLYLFDIEPGGSESVTHVYCDGVQFLAGSPVSGSHQFINGNPGTADNRSYTYLTNCRFGSYGTHGISPATMRTRGDVSGAETKALYVTDCDFAFRMIANPDPSTLIDCHFTNLTLGNHPFFNATLGNDCSMTNVNRPDGTALVLGAIASTAKVSITNCTGVPDRIYGVGSPFIIRSADTGILTHTEVRSILLSGTGYVDVLRIGHRASYIITVAGNDATSGVYGMGIGRAYASCSDDYVGQGATQLLVNTGNMNLRWKDATSGTTSVDRRTLQIYTDAVPSDRYMVKVETFSFYALGAGLVTWLV